MTELKPDLSDAAIAVFAFAAYHQLGSGQPVKSVIREDGKGHKADEAAVEELQAARLVDVRGNDITFTETGLEQLSSIVERMKEVAHAT